ncbi:MAG: addiction module protein [Verrucomicrobiota bacterium]
MADVLQLSVAERIQLAEDIWDSIATAPEQMILTDAQRAELDRRLDDYHRHPDEGTPWEVLKKQLLAGK